MRIGKYETHPAADVFPLIDAGSEQYQALVADIRAHGILVPITLVPLDGRLVILDGRNRARAAFDASVALRVEERHDIDDPFAFVVSHNLQRRHLNESQRAMAAARIATLRQGERRSLSPEKASQAQAAMMLNISERSTRNAVAVLRAGVPEVIASVERGALTVYAAADLVKRPAVEQREILARAWKSKAGEVRPGHVRALVKRAAGARPAHPLPERIARASAEAVEVLRAAGRPELADAVSELLDECSVRPWFGAAARSRFRGGAA